MRRKRGFTLIELLLVIVIIGILVAVLIPRWVTSRNQAFQAAMKSDLRNLATAEEVYYTDNASYTTSLSALSGYRLSQGVSVTINEAKTGGFSASASRPPSSKRCYIFMGNVSPVGVATAEGQVSCQ